MSPEQLGVLLAAFWVAVLAYRGARPGRFLASLVLGAVSTHVGWVVLHGPVVGLSLGRFLEFTSGFSLLFFPAGPLLLAAGDAASWRVLPLALAVARGGCLLSGCCGGAEAPWGSHPSALYEIGAMLALHFLLRTERDERVAPRFLLVFGAARLATEPLRAEPALGPPLVSPEILAASWAALGLAGSAASAVGLRLTKGGRMRSRLIGGVALVAFLATVPAVARSPRGPQPPADVLACADTGHFRQAVAWLASDPTPRARATLRRSLSAGDCDPMQRSWLRRAWASSFALGLGKRAPAAAVAVLEDATVDPRDRAMHLLAHHFAEPRDRARYWQYLRHEEVALRRAALEVNERLWDRGALPMLIALEDDPDPAVARAARKLARRYLIWGALRPTPLEREQANVRFEPDDRGALRAWRAREEDRARRARRRAAP